MSDTTTSKHFYVPRQQDACERCGQRHHLNSLTRRMCAMWQALEKGEPARRRQIEARDARMHRANIRHWGVN